MADYYGERAKGGAAAIIVENTFVDDKVSRSSLVSSGMYNDHMIASHFYVAEAIKNGGAVAILQLSHGGRQASAGATGLQPVAPSAVTCKFVQREPRALSKEEIVEIEDKFAAAAVRAKMAGFNGIEIHGAHVYLICSFVSPYTNKRTDEYGGSFENRARFPLNIIRKCREAVGPDFLIGYRISGEEGVEGGLTAEDTAAFAKLIEDKVDYINVAAGIYETMEQYIIPPNYEPHAMVVPFAKKIKEAVTKCKVFTVNSMTPEMAEEALENDACDVIAFGRPLIADPFLPTKLKEGRREDVRPCCRGHEGCVSLFFAGCPIRCEVNPQCGREREWAENKAANPKNLVIVGGGVAGMEAARYAAEAGHKVTLIEKSNELGGHFIEATKPDFKQDHKNVLNWLITQVNKADIDIRLNTEATPELVKSLNPDAVFVATGSQYFKVPVEGIDKALLPDEVLNHEVETGENVVVIGGGLVGAETALDLGNAGKKVTILEMLPGIVMQDEPLSQISLLKHLAAAGVDCKTSCTVTSIKDDVVEYKDADGNVQTVPYDSVVAATGLRSNDAASKVFEGCAPKVVKLGDAVKARKIFDCFHSAWLAVRAL
jgi:2,4-dienoyl-CoA reductase-like NADH-dependent reductase (Old Yellow Enzyme family)/thioredoxin reductase